MAETAIEWATHVWNPVTGCDRVSPGCDHCYAMALARRLKAMGQPKYQRDGDSRTSGPGFGVTCHPDELNAPLRWSRPRLVFVNSMSDLFHPEVPDEFIRAVFTVMAAASRHTFQVLTKRPQRMAALVGSWAVEPSPNVWLGTSIEIDRYNFRADYLRATPAAVRFLSLEPLLGPLPSLDLDRIDWAIIGGESGSGARPLDEQWVRDLRDRCAASSTALFVKQLGSVWARACGLGGKGHDQEEWPDDLRVRQWPTSYRPLVSLARVSPS